MGLKPILRTPPTVRSGKDKDRDKKPVKKRPFRILRPVEYEAIREEARNHHRINLDVLLLTGLRYEEARMLQKHPDWFDGEFVYIPEMKGKRKEKQMERWVRLSDLGKHMLPLFFRNKRLPARQNWRDNLIRWAEKAGLDPAGIGVKVTRKTWESWLVFSFPDRIADIMFSQGHTLITSIKHYQGLPFTEEDKKGMEKYVSGWVK